MEVSAFYFSILGKGSDSLFLLTPFPAYGMWGGDRYGYASLANIDNSDDPAWDGYKYIYANSGTWVDSTSLRTYVETEERPEQGRHYVRVKKFTSNGRSVEMMGSYTRL